MPDGDWTTQCKAARACIWPAVVDGLCVHHSRWFARVDLFGSRFLPVRPDTSNISEHSKKSGVVCLICGRQMQTTTGTPVCKSHEASTAYRAVMVRRAREGKPGISYQEYMAARGARHSSGKRYGDALHEQKQGQAGNGRVQARQAAVGQRA